MNEKKFITLVGRVVTLMGALLFLSLFLGVVVIYLHRFYDPTDFREKDNVGSAAIHDRQAVGTKVKDGVHVETGFIADEGYELVIANCTGCHSSKLVIQNRATREGWKNMIIWMQTTQNLWDLGTSEEKILTYLARHYASKEQGRRKQLANIEWYELEE